MSKKRPSYVSIRARQRNIIEGRGTSKLTYSQAAKKFGVTPREFEHFTQTDPKILRRNYNRSPVYRKLFEEGKRSEVRQKLDLPRITKYKFKTKQIHEIRTTPGIKDAENRVTTGNLIRSLYARDTKTGKLNEYPEFKLAYAASDWQAYTSQGHYPNSIKAIRLLHRNKRISDEDYCNTIMTWKAMYNIADDIFAEYSEDCIEEESA